MKIPADPTNSYRPCRRVSFTDQPITEPAPSGFFLFRDSLPALAVQWALVAALCVGIVLLASCSGPSEVHAARDVAADVQDAQRQAAFVAQEMAKGRPESINPADWEAAVKAVAIANGKR